MKVSNNSKFFVEITSAEASSIKGGRGWGYNQGGGGNNGGGKKGGNGGHSSGVGP